MTGTRNPEQIAYEKMTEASKVILDQVKRFPHLMDQMLMEVEIAMIRIAIDRCDGNCAKAAKMLGINRTTLVEKRRRFKMELKTLEDR